MKFKVGDLVRLNPDVALGLGPRRRGRVRLGLVGLITADRAQEFDYEVVKVLWPDGKHIKYNTLYLKLVQSRQINEV
jgi:hypothetical protein